jgi:hypothetical protein
MVKILFWGNFPHPSRIAITTKDIKRRGGEFGRESLS